MLAFLNRFLKPSIMTPFVPEGARAYVIGDVHGCDTKLQSLLKIIQEDIATSPPVDDIYLVLLGDLIDRGPNSKSVVETLISLNYPHITPIFLLGNHEKIFLDVLSGEISKLNAWMSFGGKATCRSYNVTNLGAIHYAPEKIVSKLQASVPKEHIEFLRTFKDYWVLGDYMFVHAGIRPGRALSKQTKKDLLWIREPFLSSRSRHQHMIVHGHSIVKEAEFHINRIAIDTGAYNGGALTCLRLQGSTQSTLQSA